MNMQAERVENWRSFARNEKQIKDAEKILEMGDYVIAREGFKLAIEGNTEEFRAFIENLANKPRKSKIELKILEWLKKELQEKYSQQLKDPQNEEISPSLNNINICIKIVEREKEPLAWEKIKAFSTRSLIALYLTCMGCSELSSGVKTMRNQISQRCEIPTQKEIKEHSHISNIDAEDFKNRLEELDPNLEVIVEDAHNLKISGNNAKICVYSLKNRLENLEYACIVDTEVQKADETIIHVEIIPINLERELPIFEKKSTPEPEPTQFEKFEVDSVQLIKGPDFLFPTLYKA